MKGCGAEAEYRGMGLVSAALNETVFVSGTTGMDGTFFAPDRIGRSACFPPSRSAWRGGERDVLSGHEGEDGGCAHDILETETTVGMLDSHVKIEGW